MDVPAELRQLVESLPDPHVVIADDYRILAANRAYREAFQPRGEVIGKTCHRVSHGSHVPCDQAGETCPLARVRESGSRERVVHLHHHANGAAYVEIEILPIQLADGKRVFLERQQPLKTGHGERSAEGLVGRAPAFQKMVSLITRVASTETNVMLLGESGTGKELAAQAIHAGSRYAKGPFVAVDCASIPENLFEAELFGHEKGAFTGAAQARSGLVDAASGGTLFLDEVGDIPLPMQVKLLRLIESATFRRVGSTELRRARVRLVSATHRDLPRMVANGQFRQDLYFRLATFPVRVPALRERKEDIAMLANSLLLRLKAGSVRKIADDGMALLLERDWPGNVRELRNLIERALVFCDGDVLRAQHLREALALEPDRPASTASASSMDPQLPNQAPLEGLKKSILDYQARNESSTAAELVQRLPSRRDLARALGISERTLYRRLAEKKQVP